MTTNRRTMAEIKPSPNMTEFWECPNCLNVIFRGAYISGSREELRCEKCGAKGRFKHMHILDVLGRCNRND